MSKLTADDYLASLSRSAFRGHSDKRIEDEVIPIRPNMPVRATELEFGVAEDDTGARVIAAHPRPIRCGCADGWVIVEVPDPYTDDPGEAKPFEETRPCSCQQIPEVARAVTGLGLPARLLERNAIFANSGPRWQKPAWAACSQFLRGQLGALILSSAVTGSGKTLIASRMAMRFALWGRSVRLATMGRLSDELYETFSHRSRRGRGDLIRELANLDLLVIDELIFGKVDWVSMLTEVVNARYNSRRPLIITTNLDAEEVEQAVGARAWSRLCEMGLPGGPVIDFPGAQDMRRGAVGGGQ